MKLLRSGVKFRYEPQHSSPVTCLNNVSFHAVRVSMEVSQLLAERPGPVLSTHREVTMHHVAETLREHKISLLVVCGTRSEVVGVI